MKKELASKYDHKSVEKGKYQHWLEKEYFKAGDVSKKPYAIVIPPPNVTGKLHLGHAWDTTLQVMMLYGFQVWIMLELPHKQKLKQE